MSFGQSKCKTEKKSFHHRDRHRIDGEKAERRREMLILKLEKNLREFTKSSHVHTRSSEFIDMPACNKHRKSRDSLVILTKGIKVGEKELGLYFVQIIFSLTSSVMHCRREKTQEKSNASAFCLKYPSPGILLRENK